MKALLVGMYFRPPAKLLLDILPAGTELALHPDPRGEYSGSPHTDEDALCVEILGAELGSKLTPSARLKLEDELPSCGWTLERVLGEERIHLGFLAREGNKQLEKLIVQGFALKSAKQVLSFMEGTTDWLATLLWGPNGEAQILILERETGDTMPIRLSHTGARG